LNKREEPKERRKEERSDCSCQHVCTEKKRNMHSRKGKKSSKHACKCACAKSDHARREIKENKPQTCMKWACVVSDHAQREKRNQAMREKKENNLQTYMQVDCVV